jgi:type IV secretory pathway VirB4 component
VSGYFLTFLYLPPAEEAARAETWLYEGRERSGVDPHEILRAFTDRTDRVLALLDGFMPECDWLDDSETLTYLHSTVSTNRHRVRVPETPVYLDALLADQPLTGGLEPRLGDSICASSPSSAFRPRPRPACSTTSTGSRSRIAGRRARSCSTRPTRPSC